MVSDEGARGTVRVVLGGIAVSAPFWIRGRNARNTDGIDSLGQPGGVATVAAGASVDRAGAVVREKPVGIGRDVFEQPAADLADESAGRQRGAAAHDGVAGRAANRLAIAWASARTNGVWLGAGKNRRVKIFVNYLQIRINQESLSEHPL